MKEFDPAELSALLDGELHPARAREVEALVAADPLLSAEFEQLQRADQQLKAFAKNSAFAAEINWRAAQPGPPSKWLAAGLAVVVAAWASSKLAPHLAVALGINAMALVLFIACMMSLARHERGAQPPLFV